MPKSHPFGNVPAKNVRTRKYGPSGVPPDRSTCIDPGPSGELKPRVRLEADATWMLNVPVFVELQEATRIRYGTPAVPGKVTLELDPHPGA
jgi:hypothetical protein